MRDNLYLAALLHHIDALKGEFNQLINDNIQAYLRKADEYAVASTSFSKGDFQRVASPFETLKKSKKDNSRTFNYGYQVLNLGSGFFPSQLPTDKTSIPSLWQKFAQDYEKLKGKAPKSKAETTLHLLHKYAVTIPNPSNIHPEVSFYDYAKIKAGLAVCLYDYLNEKDQSRGLDYSIQNTDNPLLIIRADISGIQEFIGSIASKNASKSLKGRSFYVQLLVDTVLKLMLKKLDLYEGNVMYASGGNFFVIAPNTEAIRKAFKKFEKNITTAIFEEHKTRIAVVMGAQEVTHQQILNQELGKNGKKHGVEKAIKSLFEQIIDKKKKQKFAQLIATKYDNFFDENQGDHGGEIEIDAITGEELIGYKIPLDRDEDNTTNDRKFISPSTDKQIQIGKHLKNVDAIFSGNDRLIPGQSQDSERLRREFEIFPLKEYHKITKDETDRIFYYLAVEDKYSFLVKKPFAKDIVTINELNFIKSESRISDFMLYGGNDAPRKIDEEDGRERTKYFDELSGLGDFKRLGILKMDIDGLGGIFKNYIPYPHYNPNLPKEERNGDRRSSLSFAYYAALSRNLDWFFKGYLNSIWNNEESKFSEDTQIIYSGGDDLFIVGKWNRIIAFAEEIKTKFSTFACTEILDEKERLTISGGVSIVTHKFPIMKASAFADAAEKKAKRHESISQSSDEKVEKNSISVFGVELNWDNDEYATVKKLKEQLMDAIGDERDKLPRSLLGKIKGHYHMMAAYNAAKKRGEKVNPRWIWNLVYDFSRFQTKNNKKYKPFLEEMKQNIFSNKEKSKALKSSHHYLTLLYVAARWAELEIRTKRGLLIKN